MKLRNYLIALGLGLAFLVSCGLSTLKINFASDPLILRGNWSGQITDGQTMTPIRLSNLVATYVDKSAYAISGSIQYGNDQPLLLIGQVSAGFGIEYIQPQTTQLLKTEFMYATLTDKNGANPKDICFELWRNDGLYDGSVAGTSVDETGKKICSIPTKPQSITLRPTP
jgi:hypothetical protein